MNGGTNLIRTRQNTKNLTAAQIRSELAPGKYFDGSGTGLFLFVKPNGSRFWVQRITIRGKRAELGLGSPPLVTLSQARDAAMENKRTARAGGDPLRDKREAAAVLTFEDAARKVHELHKPTWRNEKHAAQFISTLETYAFPRLGSMKVGDVAAADVLAVLSPIWTTKRETARRVKQRIGTVMKWAIAQGWRHDNPADAIAEVLPRTRQEKVHRKSLPYAQVAACMETVEASRAGHSTKLAFRLLVLTASRSGEVRLACWGQIDWNAKGGPIWSRPASVMKAKVAHSVPLSRQAVEVLQAAKSLSDSDDPEALIFPGAIPSKPLSDATLLKLVREQGFPVDIHGFRTSFKTWAQERTNFSREVSEAALAHTIKDKAEAAYARSELMDKRRALGEAWAGYLAQESAKLVRVE